MIIKSKLTQNRSKAFGHTAREAYWDFDHKNTPLNHGSFGACPLPVREARNQILAKIEANPDLYMRTTLYEDVEAARATACEWIDSEPLNTVFVQNATVGFNTVIRSLPLKKGDTIIYCSTTYGACEKTLKFLELRHGIKHVSVDINYPMSDDEIVDAYRQAIDAHPSTVLCLFDTVSSMPAAILPYNELVALCREKEVLSFIDGAHSIGLIPVSMRKTQPDFYVTNVHKWGYGVRGGAILYVAEEHHRLIHTLPVSHTYLDDSENLEPEQEERRLIDRFTFIGTQDFSPYMAITAAYEFRKQLGGEAQIRKYCNDLAIKVGDLAASQWRTEVLGHAGAMVTVRLPIPEEFLAAASEERKQELFQLICDHPLTRGTYVPPIYHNGKMYVRFSAQVYNELEDYQVGIDAVNEALDIFFMNEVEEVQDMWVCV
ncbi:Hercynylcysteine sulfoxide lyase [Yarrowia sp. B02]|nr:Hercynylcysteine sulfoxide lyase [Yarrowia sp. B02]